MESSPVSCSAVRRRFNALACGVVVSLCAALPAQGSSMVVATGTATVDGRPVLWKNRDHWSTPDGWQVYAYNYFADSSSFGTGDTYTSRFNYVGVTAEGSSGVDEVSMEQVPWAGVNERGLALSQVAGHTLTSGFAHDHEYDPPSQDIPNGMSGGYINHLVLSRCEHVDEVEQLLRDTNDGGGFYSSFARNTSTMISVADRYGNAAIFEIDGDSFTRDNITTAYAADGNGNYTAAHDDDKDSTNPADGAYSGFDWRNNFSKVDWTKPNGFPYFIDEQITEVVIDANGNDSVQNSGSTPDGIHDWETSTSAVMRHTRAGIRVDDSHLKDYRYFIHKNVGSGALGTLNTIETLARNIGELPTAPTDKPTGYHLNRFVSTFSTVLVGAKSGDPYDGKLAAMWVALGEPTVGLFVPLFPFAEEVPTSYADMAAEINDKRHLVYLYVDDDADDYSGGRNVDHSIDTVALAGPGGYYGEGGIQKYTFAIEDWGFDQFDGFMASLRDGTRTLTQLQTDTRQWQANVGSTMKAFYVAGAWPNSYEAESWANSLTGSAARVASTSMSWRGKVMGIGLNSDLTFQKVRVVGPGTYQLKIHYAAASNRALRLSVNGDSASIISFASTGGADTLGTHTVGVTLMGGDNTLRFFNTTSTTPSIDRVEVLSRDTIVDNTDTGFTTAGTGWNANTSVSGFWGRNYLSDGTSGSDATSKYARWTPDIPVAGTYKIYMRWSASSNRPDAAPLEIHYDGGVDTSKTVNQQTDGGTWKEIGTYTLAAGTSNYVVLYCSDAGFTIADAVRFELQ